jgi:hypothetical protein
MGIKHGISWDLLSGIHNGPWESNYVNHGIDHGNTMEYSMGLKKINYHTDTLWYTITITLRSGKSTIL